MSAHPAMTLSSSLAFPTTILLGSSSSPPGPVRRSGGPASESSPALRHRKHVVPRNTNRSFTPSSSTTFPSTRHEIASMRTHGPMSATSSRSGRPIGVATGISIALASSPFASASLAFSSAAAIAAASSSLNATDFPPGSPLCPVHVWTTSPSSMSRTRTRTTGLTSNERNFSPGISSWKSESDPGTRFICAPIGSSMPTY
mmetsp:Transcript_7217/g.26463  ORF Transcript_7217/g.26463 Transcript_7217/m.26463 type:complete len:201 (+) Transcript_7217:298-900(+)